MYIIIPDLPCEKYCPTLIKILTVRAGTHVLIQSKCAKANMNFCGSLIVVFLCGSEFPHFTVPGKNAYICKSLLVWMVLNELCRQICLYFVGMNKDCVLRMQGYGWLSQ